MLLRSQPVSPVSEEPESKICRYDVFHLVLCFHHGGICFVKKFLGLGKKCAGNRKVLNTMPCLVHAACV